MPTKSTFQRRPAPLSPEAQVLAAARIWSAALRPLFCVSSSRQASRKGSISSAQPALQLAGVPVLQSSVGSSQHSAASAAMRDSKSPHSWPPSLESPHESAVHTRLESSPQPVPCAQFASSSARVQSRALSAAQICSASASVALGAQPSSPSPRERKFDSDQTVQSPRCW